MAESADKAEAVEETKSPEEGDSPNNDKPAEAEDADLSALILAYFADLGVFAAKLFTPSVDTIALGAILKEQTYTIVLVIGGAGVIWTGFYSRWLDRKERAEEDLATIADFEHQFNGGQSGAASQD